MQRMSDSVSDAKSYARSIGESTNLPDIIRTWDKTVPTDNNLFSARRSQESLSARTAPTVPKRKSYSMRCRCRRFHPRRSRRNHRREGNAELLTLLVRALLSSPKFALTASPAKASVYGSKTGCHTLTVDKMTVRQIMTVFETLIKKIRSVGGQICVMSAANGKIKKSRRSTVNI